MKRTFFYIFLLLCLLLVSGVVLAQGETFGGVRNALRSASSKELSQYFGGNVDISFDGDRQSYSATQAEFVMKDFFAKTAPVTFDIVHQGASQGGIPYAIGKYNGKSGPYRVFVKMKNVNGALRIDTMDFTKE